MRETSDARGGMWRKTFFGCVVGAVWGVLFLARGRPGEPGGDRKIMQKRRPPNDDPTAIEREREITREKIGT